MAKWSEPERTWERQPKESAKAYEAFQTYLSMGTSRSLVKVSKKLGKSEVLISRWSSAWKWQDRLRDYDNYLNRQELEEKRKALKKMQERHIQIAVMMQKKAVKALEELPEEYLDAKDILRFLVESTKIEKETRLSELPQEDSTQTASGSLADSIIEAYKKREGSGVE